jgi:serine/threonine protein kinase
MIRRSQGFDNHASSNASTHDMIASPLPQKTRTGPENCLGIGTRVGEFEITGIVGEGGFGTVYLAFDHSLQRTIALKEYLPPALASRGADEQVAVRSKRHQETFEAGLKSFINEARLLAQFDHPALIKVYRFWEQNNTAYMAMRYYEGRTVKAIVRDEPEIATEAWWKSILKPVLEALSVLYSVQILHRDISPENIIIQPNGEPVLLDFGAARQLIQNSTQALTVILKPGFAPVEQYADDPSMKQGPWTDIYALSAVVYSAIARKAPPASVARLLKDPMGPLTQDDFPGYSRQFLFAISKGMAVKPEDRPQTIAEFSQLLGLDKPGTDASSASSMTGKSSSGKSRERTATGTASEKNRRQSGNAQATATKTFAPQKWIVGIAGMACVAALGLYFYAGKSSSPAGAQASAALPAAPAPRVETVAAASPVQIAAQPAADANANAGSSPTPSPRWQTVESAPAPAVQPANEIAGKPDDKPARTPLRAAAKENGAIQLQVKPWGTILVDGVSMGVSPPLKQLTLPEGKHQIRVVNPNFRDHVVDVHIAGKKTVKIEHNFSRITK